jgi:hypothetical protein
MWLTKSKTKPYGVRIKLKGTYKHLGSYAHTGRGRKRAHGGRRRASQPGCPEAEDERPEGSIEPQRKTKTAEGRRSKGLRPFCLPGQQRAEDLIR